MWKYWKANHIKQVNKETNMKQLSSTSTQVMTATGDQGHSVEPSKRQVPMTQLLYWINSGALALKKY